MSDPVVVKWAWRHGALDAEFCDSLEDALSSARYARDYGEEALDSIEVIENGVSRILTDDEIEAYNRPREEEELRQLKERPPAVAHIRLVSPSGQETAPYEGFASRTEADRKAEELRAKLGTGRVRVENVRFPYPV